MSDELETGLEQAANEELVDGPDLDADQEIEEAQEVEEKTIYDLKESLIQEDEYEAEELTISSEEVVPPPIRQVRESAREGMAMAGFGRRTTGQKERKTADPYNTKRGGVHKVYPDKELDNIGKGTNASHVQERRGKK